MPDPSDVAPPTTGVLATPAGFCDDHDCPHAQPTNDGGCWDALPNVPAIAIDRVLAIVDEVEAMYPEDVFLPDSTSPDALAAKGARVACAAIRRAVTEGAS